MKLVEFRIRETPPVELIDVKDLTEVVAFAGPNGVGKTSTLTALLAHFQTLQPSNKVSLKVVATTSSEQSHWKGAAKLDTADPAQADILRRFLQRSQKRGELRGGVLNFDSSRSFENIQPYAWSWDFQDPFDEAIGWQQTYQPVRNRFQDVIHSMLRKVRSHKEAISDRAISLMEAGETTMPLQLGDPLEKFKQAFARLLPGKILLNLDQKTQAIQYRSGGVTLPLTSLSSGEREVVTIVFDFLLRDPHDCVVVFDEPELHLHPELSYRLLRTLREVGERNQFLFCTHSPDIITASLDQTVVFIAPPKGPGVNQAITVREDDAAADVLHLLGQSVGVISLGRRLVLIEGANNSLDKQTYGAIVGADYPELVLVPTGGK
jgi:energy-coupling factor transporter ATP-binding protein EcfA2